MADRPQAGLLLRQWRELRGKSQLELSLDAGVSQRHISFIEIGRSVPSRQMLIDIAAVLDVPLRDRNTLLLAGGYAPIYSDGAWDGPEMRRLERMLRQHEPFPALVMDRYWNVLVTNQAAPRFFNCFCDLTARKSPRNMLELMFDPAGMRPFVAEIAKVVATTLFRISRATVSWRFSRMLRSLNTRWMGQQVPGMRKCIWDGASYLCSTPMEWPEHAFVCQASAPERRET